MAVTTATVETLTAEVRVLMVGSRQVTLSVARQLDYCPWEHLEPMGRVRLPMDRQAGWECDCTSLIGRDRRTGSLVRYTAHDPDVHYNAPERWAAEMRAAFAVATDLPLIVLAGLR